MELIEGSETSANYNLTPGKHPKEQIHYSQHGESLKSSIHFVYKSPSLLHLIKTEIFIALDTVAMLITCSLINNSKDDNFTQT
jgi:hypothetical protein